MTVSTDSIRSSYSWATPKLWWEKSKQKISVEPLATFPWSTGPRGRPSSCRGRGNVWRAEERAWVLTLLQQDRSIRKLQHRFLDQLNMSRNKDRNETWRCVLIQHENEEQLRLEEVLRTPESISRLDGTLPRNRRRLMDAQGQLVASLICTCSFVICNIDWIHLFLRWYHTKTDVVTHWIPHFPL